MKKRIAAWLALGLITVIAGLMLAMTNEVTKDRIKTQEIEAQEQARKDVLPSADLFEAIEMENLAPLTELYAGKSGDEVVGYVGMASSTGYGGPVQVIAGVDTEGKVTGVSVGGSDFAETAGLGAKAKDAAFMEQFAGKRTPVRAVKSAADRGDNTIDAITAATITSNAVTGSVNSIANKIDAYLNPDDGMPAEGTTYTASAQGFAGPVAVFVTVKDESVITGLEIGDDQFAETEGFGQNAKNPDFTKQFIGKTLPLTIDDIDAISGATITTNAVIAALNQAIEDKVVVAPATPEGTRYTASEKGFAGPVAVFVTVKGDDTITALEIGDDQFAETDGFGLQAKEPAFIKQFIGKTLPVGAEDIDAVSGATITTNAVIAAINRAYEEKLVDESVNQMQEPAQTEEPASSPEPVIPEGARTATASSQGFAGPVAVTIWLDEDDTIAAMTVGDADFAETQGFGTRTQDEAYTSTYIGKKLPLAEGDMDVLSGATVTSKAIIAAINLAAEELGLVTEEALEATEVPAEEPQAEPEGRTATASSKGFAGPVAVTITLNEDDTIASLTVGDADFAETQGIGTRAQDEVYTSTYIGKKVPLSEGDVDVLSGATVTSKAIIAAINLAAEELGLVTEEAPEATEAPAEEPQAEPEGRTATASSKGFAGPVAVTITLNDDDTIASLAVGDADFAETQGIGTRAQDEEYTSTYIGKKVPLAEGDVDVLSGATVTSKAIIAAINLAAEEFGLVTEEAESDGSAAEEGPENSLREMKASAEGRNGTVAVTVTLNEDNTIASLVVGDEAFAETVGIGTRAQEEEFTSQFIGKALPLLPGDVDTLSGATITSTAVIEAINQIAEELGLVSRENAPEVGPEAGERTVSFASKGYGGPVAVTVSLSADNTIVSLIIGDENFHETVGIGSKILDDKFAGQFIGKQVPLKAGDVDTIANATISSEAVIEAINQAVSGLIK